MAYPVLRKVLKTCLSTILSLKFLRENVTLLNSRREKNCLVYKIFLEKVVL